MKKRTYKVTVDYGQTFEAMVAAGNYDDVFPSVSSDRFPITGEGKVERELLLARVPDDPKYSPRSASEVIAELDRHGLRPAKIEDLLALGARYPGLQREFQIVVIGSRWADPDGGHVFPFLSYHEGERILNGDDFTGGGIDPPDFSGVDLGPRPERILAVRKDAA